MKSSIHRIGRVLLVAPILVLAACATEPPANTVAKLATARESIKQAESAGATQLAPVEMLSARDKLSRAEVASRDKHYAEASSLTDEATADANLAERKSRTLKSQRAQQDLQQSNSVLVDELSRKPQ
jgi:Domain of unknown function (DUF4398)